MIFPELTRVSLLGSPAMKRKIDVFPTPLAPSKQEHLPAGREKSKFLKRHCFL